MGRGSAYPKVHTDHVLEYISLRNTMDSPSDCPLVTSPLLQLLPGVAHYRFAPHLHSPSRGPSLSPPPTPIPAIHRLPTCSSCITGLSTTLSSESPQHPSFGPSWDGKPLIIGISPCRYVFNDGRTPPLDDQERVHLKIDFEGDSVICGISRRCMRY